MKYRSYMVVVQFEGMDSARVFEDVAAVDQEAAHADIAEAYGPCRLLGFKVAE